MVSELNTNMMQDKLAAEIREVSLPTLARLCPLSCPLHKFRVVVHAGGSMSSGHYYAHVRNCAGVWNRMDDCSVSKVRLSLTDAGGEASLLKYRR